MLPYSGVTTVYVTANMEEEARRIRADNYYPLGQSNFQGTRPVSLKQLQAEGEKVGADLVLYHSEYLGSETRAAVIPQYVPGTTSTTSFNGTAQAQAFGTGGSSVAAGSYQGTAVTQSEGTWQNQTVPITVRYSAHNATFWRKRPRPVMGALVYPLSDVQRASLHRNTGVFVDQVINDSPAFRANILIGDIITQLDDHEVVSVTDYVAEATAAAGRNVSVHVLRGTQSLVIPVQTNPLEEGEPAKH